MVGEDRGQRLKTMPLKDEVPMLVAEHAIQAHQSGPSPFVAPGVLPVLEGDFFQLAVGECCTKLSHSTQV